MALMPVEWLSHSTGIFVYFGLAYLRFEGLIPLPGNIYLRFRGVAKTLCTEYIGHLLIEIMRFA